MLINLLAKKTQKTRPYPFKVAPINYEMKLNFVSEPEIDASSHPFVKHIRAFPLQPTNLNQSTRSTLSFTILDPKTRSSVSDLLLIDS